MDDKNIERKMKLYLAKRPELSELSLEEAKYLAGIVGEECFDNIPIEKLLKTARQEVFVYC